MEKVKIKTELLIVIVLRYIDAFFNILFSVLQLVPAFEIITFLEENGLIMAAGYNIANIIIALGIIVSLILIQCKKKKGIYCYFIFELINIVFLFIVNGFRLTMILDILIPVFMYLFIKNQKEIFK